MGRFEAEIKIANYDLDIAESLAPLSYVRQGRRIDLAFWRVPDRLFDEPGELVDWARAALAAAHRVADKRGTSGGQVGVKWGSFGVNLGVFTRAVNLPDSP